MSDSTPPLGTHAVDDEQVGRQRWSSLEGELIDLTSRYEATQDLYLGIPAPELEATVSRFSAGKPNGSYLTLSEHISQLSGFARLASNVQAQANYLRTLLFLLIKRFLKEGAVSEIKLPAYADVLFGKEARRILKCLNGVAPYEFTLSSETYQKDLAICSGKLIPAGCQVVEASGVPRRILLSGGRRQFIRSARFFLCRFHGFSPTFEIHLHMPNRHLFSQAGRNLCYQLVADLLHLNPQFKGLHGSSWFYDPALKEVSPHLTYVGDVPKGAGGEAFYVGAEGEHSAAFQTSKTRRDRYQAGEYSPRTYLLAWPTEGLKRHTSQLSRSAIYEYLQS